MADSKTGVRLRWQSGMLMLNGETLVGSVSQGASGHWFAFGCLNDWEDTKLGVFEDEAKARSAVKSWVEETLD